MVALGMNVAARHRAESPSFSARRERAPANSPADSPAQSPWPQIDERQIDDRQETRAARRGTLADAIQGTVLPRLLLTRGAALPRTDLGALCGPAPVQGDVDALCALL